MVRIFFRPLQESPLCGSGQFKLTHFRITATENSEIAGIRTYKSASVAKARHEA